MTGKKKLNVAEIAIAFVHMRGGSEILIMLGYRQQLNWIEEGRLT